MTLTIHKGIVSVYTIIHHRCSPLKPCQLYAPTFSKFAHYSNGLFRVGSGAEYPLLRKNPCSLSSILASCQLSATIISHQSIWLTKPGLTAPSLIQKP